MPPHLVMLTLARVWPVLECTGAPIAIAGGIALSYWGNPRSTQDIDLAVNTRDEASILHKLYAGRMIDLADVANLLEHHWSQLEQDYLHRWSVKLSIEAPWRDAKDRYHSSLD